MLTGLTRPVPSSKRRSSQDDTYPLSVLSAHPNSDLSAESKCRFIHATEASGPKASFEEYRLRHSADTFLYKLDTMRW